jgi:transposase-like protein
MHTIEVSRKFAEENACVDYLEAMRWSDEDSMFCRKCGLIGKSNFRSFTTKQTSRKRFSKTSGKVKDKPVRSRRLHECKNCGRQFSVKNDTVFGWTHLSLGKWFAAVALMLEAKKGMSAMQMCRHLGIDPKKNYKSVWYLCHRIREAMIEAGVLTGVVEADETYLTPKKPRKGKPYVKKQGRDVVLGMIERGGKLHLVPIKDAKIEIIEPVLAKHISPDVEALHTDEHPTYHIIGKRHYAGKHRAINHTRTYAIGDLHTNTIENAFSLLKRGIYGTFHKVSIKHLARYCNEFSYRFNRRDAQVQMFDATIKGLLKAKPLPFKKLIASVELSEPLNPADPAF